MTICVLPIEVCSHDTKNYSYLIHQEGQSDAIIVDPAWEAYKYEALIQQENLRPTDILLTHAHKDHTDLVEAFAKAYKARVWMSEIEVKHYHYRCQNLQFVFDKQKILCGAIEVLPLLTPGHTIGSTCYQIADHLFTGDTLFIEGCGMCFEAGSDPGDMYESVMRLKREIEPQVKIYPGHRYGYLPGMDFQFVKKHNVYLHFDSKERFINFRMRPNQTNWFNYL